MLYAPQWRENAPIDFDLFDGTALDADAARTKLKDFEAGNPIELDGGVEVARINLEEGQLDVLAEGISTLDNYGTLALPGDLRANPVELMRYRNLPQRARKIILDTHVTFREIVRLEAERSQLIAPNRHVGRAEAGLYYRGKGIGWHPDSNATFDTEEERLSSLQGHGIVRYTLSLFVPGTDLAKGLLFPEDVLDGVMVAPDLDVGSEHSQLQIATHAAAVVVRFLSDYDVHRSHPLLDDVSTPRYFDTASAAMQLG